jgi:glycosyltransferase involved in cell wall biosynthesis
MDATQKGGTESQRGSLLFVNQHYYPDVASTGQHLTDLAEYLVRQGWSVEVVAAQGKYLAGRMPAPAREERNGVTIHRLRTASFGRSRHFGRIADYASFYVQVLVRLLFGRRHTGVVFLTTPPLLGLVGAIVKLLRGQRYGIWSMDLHPHAEIASGMLDAKSFAGRVLSAANAFGYRQADLVIDLGRYMKERIVAMGVRPDRCHTVHVWSDAREIVPTPREENPLIDRLGLRDKFVVMYSGNAGIVHDFRDILDAMRRLRDDARIHFLFVGDGPRRAEIEAYVREHDIRNFEYRGYFAREELRYSLSIADAHLVSLREPFVGISVPGKLYGIMAAGRPAIFVGPSRCESAEAVVATECGVVIDPSTRTGAGQLVETLRTWSTDPAAVRALGARGRAAFEALFERERNCLEFAEVLREAWATESSAASDLVPELAS